MKNVFALVLAVLLTVSIAAGCGAQETPTPTAEPTADTQAPLQARIEELENQLAEMAATADSAAAMRYAIGINALLSLADSAAPQAELVFEGAASITATAQVPEGMVLDRWRVNGETIEGQQDGTLTLDAQGNTVVEAVFRTELKVTTVNAYLQLLDADGEPEGDELAEYVFEDEPEKMVSLYVAAQVPADYEIDYWLINGVPYHFNRTISNFIVNELDETTEYEVVLKEAPAPVVKVSVSCINCTFSGGGYTNATSGSVPKGTKITVTGLVDIGSPQVWLVNGSEKTYSKTFTYTVNSNTTFEYTGYN